MNYMQNIHKNSVLLKYISDSRGEGVIGDPTPPPWHDVGARNVLVYRGLTYNLCNWKQWIRNEFESGGRGTRPARCAGKMFRRAPPLFGSKSTVVILVNAFVMVSTFRSVSCLLFFYKRCPVPSHL